jgi:hypothetical protein
LKPTTAPKFTTHCAPNTIKMKSSRFASIASTVFSAISLGLLLLVALSTIRSDPNHLSALEFCTVDASPTRVKVGSDELVGLPDLFGFLRHKQIYKVYLFNYCSGYYNPGSAEAVFDFCSKPREEIWDLLSLWSVWGVKLRPDGEAKFGWLDRGPDWLWIAYIVGIAASGLSFGMGLARVHRFVRVKWLVVGVSVVGVPSPVQVQANDGNQLAACALLAIATAAQVTYGSLVAQADDDNISITAKLGLWAFVLNWAAAACALSSTMLQLLYFKRTAGGRGHKGVAVYVASHAYTEVKDPDSHATALMSAEKLAPKHSLGNVSAKYEPYRGVHLED